MTVHGTGLASEPPYRRGVDRRRFLLTSLAGALAAPLAAEGLRGPGESRDAAYAKFDLGAAGRITAAAFANRPAIVRYVVTQTGNSTKVPVRS